MCFFGWRGGVEEWKGSHKGETEVKGMGHLHLSHLMHGLPRGLLTQWASVSRACVMSHLH